MGLSRDFLTMLTAPVTLERATGTDLWGNETYSPPEPHFTYISEESTAYGTGDPGGQQDRKVVSTTQIMFDAVGVKPDDRVTIGTTVYTVTGVDTSRDEFGENLYQMVTVENQKKG